MTRAGQVARLRPRAERSDCDTGDRPRDCRARRARQAGALAVTALDALLLLAALGGMRALLGHTRALALLAVWAVGGIVLALLRPVRCTSPWR